MASVQFKDYYKILAIPRTADEKAIKRAFLEQARVWHPDKNPGDPKAEERFKDINEANEVLSDPAKRKMYDRYGEDWERYRAAGYTGDEPAGQRARPGGQADFGQWFAGQSPPQGGFGGADNEGFSDFFRTLFGQRGYGSPQAPRRRRGEDLETETQISFDEAYKGTTRQITITAGEPCPTCKGAAYVREAPCPTCDATGSIPRRKTIEISIPAGVETGARIRAAGQGGPGSDGGPAGDVYLRVRVATDPRFARDGDDLKTEVTVPLYTLLLGGEALVLTPTGKVALTVPPESQPGKVFRLRGKGMPKKGGGNGDLFARLAVTLPTGLSDEERDLLGRLRDLRPR